MHPPRQFWTQSLEVPIFQLSHALFDSLWLSPSSSHWFRPCFNRQEIHFALLCIRQAKNYLRVQETFLFFYVMGVRAFSSLYISFMWRHSWSAKSRVLWSNCLWRMLGNRSVLFFQMPRKHKIQWFVLVFVIRSRLFWLAVTPSVSCCNTKQVCTPDSPSTAAPVPPPSKPPSPSAQSNSAGSVFFVSFSWSQWQLLSLHGLVLVFLTSYPFGHFSWSGSSSLWW